MFRLDLLLYLCHSLMFVELIIHSLIHSCLLDSVTVHALITTAIYVAANATYIRLLHGKIGFLEFFSALAP